MIDIVAIVMIMSIPLSAILGSFYLKSKKLSLEAGANPAQLAALLEENKELRKRIENLEAIASEPKTISLESKANPEVQRQIELLAEEIARLKRSNSPKS